MVELSVRAKIYIVLFESGFHFFFSFSLVEKNCFKWGGTNSLFLSHCPSHWAFTFLLQASLSFPSLPHLCWIFQFTFQPVRMGFMSKRAALSCQQLRYASNMSSRPTISLPFRPSFFLLFQRVLKHRRFNLLVWASEKETKKSTPSRFLRSKRSDCSIFDSLDDNKRHGSPDLHRYR